MRRRHVFWLIVLAGVIIRIGLVYFSSDLDVSIDTWKYDRIAQNIAFKGIYSIQRLEASQPRPTAIYPPGYPLFLASLYRMFGHRPFLANYLHIVFYLLACLVIFRLSCDLFDGASGLWAVLFFTFEPISLLYSIVAIPEILIAVFLPLSVYYLLKFLRQDAGGKIRYRYLILSSIIIGLAMLTKPAIFYFPLMLILSIFIYWRRRIKKAIIASLLTVFVAGVIISPWIIRNYIIWNRFSFVEMKCFLPPEKRPVRIRADYVKWRFKKCPESIRGPALRYLFGTGTITFFRTYERTDDLHRYFLSQKKSKKSAASPKWCPKWSGYSGVPDPNDYYALFGYSWRFLLVELLFIMALLVIYISAFMGAFFALKRGKIKELLILISIIIYFSAVIFLEITSNSRYRFPSIPFYAILAGYGLSRLLSPRRMSH